MTAPAQIVHPALGFCVSLWHNGGNGREPSAPGKGRGIALKIAIVDDDAAMRGQLQAGIEEQLGTVQFSGFPDGESFLAAWQPGAFDLVILDIFIGALTGMDVAEKLRETDRAVQVFSSTLLQDLNGGGSDDPAPSPTDPKQPDPSKPNTEPEDPTPTDGSPTTGLADTLLPAAIIAAAAAIGCPLITKPRKTDRRLPSTK